MIGKERRKIKILPRLSSWCYWKGAILIIKYECIYVYVYMQSWNKQKWSLLSNTFLYLEICRYRLINRDKLFRAGHFRGSSTAQRSHQRPRSFPYFLVLFIFLAWSLGMLPHSYKRAASAPGFICIYDLIKHIKSSSNQDLFVCSF